LETLLFVLFSGATLVQILVWGILFSRMAWPPVKNEPDKNAQKLPGVSIIICARNEAKNLRNNLPKIIQQQYPTDFEIIVVDDASSDETIQVLEVLKQTCTTLKVLQIKEKKRPGKKYALEQGIRSARYDWLLLTDADCSPASPFWVNGMMQHSTNPATEIIVGYAPLKVAGRGQSNLLFFLQYEAAYTALQCGAFIVAGIPYMGVGRNLAWNKTIFEKNKGFSAHEHVVSGDDDLFVNSVANRENTQLCLLPGTFMASPAPADWQAWLRQKRRHLSVGNLYRPVHRILLGGTALTHTLHYGLGAILLIWGHYFFLTLICYFLRMIVVWPISLRVFARLKEERLALLLPFWDGLLAVWYGTFAPFFIWGKNNIRW